MAQIAFRGNASKSPEMKFFDDGTAIAKASIAENHWRQNRQTNEWEQTGTTWWNVVVRGKNAERFAQNVDKGTRLVIFGRVTSRSYEKDGEKRSFTEVSVRDSSSSTQLNMKQKKAATPMPLAIRGMKMRVKKRGKE